LREQVPAQESTVANKLITPQEAAESFRQAFNDVVAKHGLTDEQQRALLDAISLSLSGPGVERASQTVA
jgi:hypothetical protein